MKQYYLAYIICCIILSGACTSSIKKEESDLLVFDPTKVEFSEITLSDIADDITYIQLDTTIMFSGISPTILFEEDFLVVDAANIGVLKYNREGKFISKVGGIGQGPGEYDQYSYLIGGDCRDYFFVRTDRYDIYYYNLTADFQKKIKLQGVPNDQNFTTSYFFNNQFYLFNHIFPKYEEPYLWSIANISGEIISSKKDLNFVSSPNLYDGSTFFPGSVASYNGNHLLYWGHYGDTIFKFTKENIEPFCVWAKGNYRMTTEKVQKRTNDFLVPANIFNLTNYILFYMRDAKSGQYLFFFYNKSLKKFTGVNHPIIDDINGGSSLYHIDNSYSSNSNEYLITIIQPYDLKDDLIKSDTPKSRALAETIDDEGNQVLVLIRLKK